jgi:hypothetical protein
MIPSCELVSWLIEMTNKFKMLPAFIPDLIFSVLSFFFSLYDSVPASYMSNDWRFLYILEHS